MKLEFYDDRVIKAIAEAKKTALTKASLRVKANAKRLCPVDTGNLRQKIENKVHENFAEVGTNVEYAQAVEFGVPNPVVIVPKNAKVLAWRLKGTKKRKDGKNMIFAKRVVIPPRRPRPFLYPALNNNKDYLTKVFSAEVNRRLKQL